VTDMMKEKFFTQDILFGILLVGILILIFKMYEYINCEIFFNLEGGLIVVAGLFYLVVRRIKISSEGATEVGEVTVNLAGVGILVCKRYKFCDKGDKYNGFVRDECNSIVPNKCGEWCCHKVNCKHLCIIPTEETKISFGD